MVRYYRDYKTKVVSGELVTIYMRRWVIAGPYGVCEYAHSEQKAAKLADEWEEFYTFHLTKHNLLAG